MRTAQHRLGLTLLLTIVAFIGIVTLTPAEEPLALEFGHWCLVCGRSGTADVVANVILFLPLGLGAALVGWPLRRAVAAGLALSVGVELAQLLVVPGRFATLSDVVTNSTGSLLGALAGRHWRSLAVPTPPLARRLAGLAALGWLAVMAIAAWALQRDPAPGPERPVRSPLPSAPYAGWYAGRPVEATVEGTRLAHRGTGPVLVLARTGRAVQVALTVEGRDARRSFVPILYVHGTRDPDAEALIGQRGDHAVLRVRLRARRARLRPMEVVLPGFFDGAGEATRSHLRGGLAGATLVLQGARRDPGGARTAEELPPRSAALALSPTLGWALLLPYVRASDPVAPWVSAGWIAALLAPLGFWGAHAARGGRTMPVGLAAASLVGGLWVIPRLGSFRPTSPGEWAAALVGVLGGMAGAWLVHALLAPGRARRVSAAAGAVAAGQS